MKIKRKYIQYFLHHLKQNDKINAYSEVNHLKEFIYLTLKCQIVSHKYLGLIRLEKNIILYVKIYKLTSFEVI